MTRRLKVKRQQPNQEIIQNALNAIGERIRKSRTATGLSLDELAERANVTKNTVSSIENATCIMKLDTFLRIARGLQISPSVLLQEDTFSAKDEQRWREIIRLTSKLNESSQEIAWQTMLTLIRMLEEKQES